MSAAAEPFRQRILEQRDGAVLIVTIDCPSRKNAIAPVLRAAMEDVMERAHGDHTIRAIVVTGAEGTFCAGGDISSMDIDSTLAGRERMRRTHKLVRLMAKGGKPIVAAVEGWAAGAGMAVACACDVIVAAEDARFTAGFHKIGLMSDMGLPHFLPARVGIGRARRILFFHEVIGAPEAERIGLVSLAVDEDQLLPKAYEVADKLAAGSQTAIRWTKYALNNWLRQAGPSFDTSLALEFMGFGGPDVREGVASLRERRAPRF